MNEEKKRPMPKGGKKGGTRFPQINLQDAIEYAKKLVSKTHTGAQPANIILTGVFGSGTAPGKVRASAMKQYGLMDGLAEAYVASELAKKIAAAPPEDLPLLLQIAALKPEVFKSLYETFKGDKVSPAKIRQQASNLEVHPENLDKCVSLFMESVQHAGLGQMNGDEISLTSVSIVQSTTDVVGEATEENAGNGSPPNDSEDEVKKQKSPVATKPAAVTGAPSDHTPSGRSVIHVNIDLDSSLDTEKLEKQLELLRRYGAI